MKEEKKEEQELPLEKLTPLERRAANKARKAAGKASAPVSGNEVGAVAIAGENLFRSGNLESAAFTPTTCAERGALVEAMNKGRLRDVHTIVVVAPGSPEKYTFPCGVCRQVISDEAQKSGVDTKIIAVAGDGKTAFVTYISVLLPHPFGAKNLKGRR